MQRNPLASVQASSVANSVCVASTHLVEQSTYFVSPRLTEQTQINANAVKIEIVRCL